MYKSKKAFTLVELLVVIAIIALLMSILMPALAMVRKMAQRAVCASNLSGLHKAIWAYSNENDDDYPRAGGSRSVWGKLNSTNTGINATGWDAKNEAMAFHEPGGTSGAGKATISSSLFLLIREADVGPKTFICKAEKDVTDFAFEDYPSPPRNPLVKDIRQCWDFGKNKDTTRGNVETMTGLPVAQYVSYSYQMPYACAYGNVTISLYGLSTASQPELAVLADRSPYLVLNPDKTKVAYQFGGNERAGNSGNHEGDGQNVLYCNGSVSFQTVSYCGMNKDNIYTSQTTSDPRIGSLPYTIASTTTYLFAPTTPWATPQVKSINASDSVLVGEGAKQGGINPNPG